MFLWPSFVLTSWPLLIWLSLEKGPVRTADLECGLKHQVWLSYCVERDVLEDKPSQQQDPGHEGKGALPSDPQTLLPTHNPYARAGPQITQGGETRVLAWPEMAKSRSFQA